MSINRFNAYVTHENERDGDLVTYDDHKEAIDNLTVEHGQEIERLEDDHIRVVNNLNTEIETLQRIVTVLETEVENLETEKAEFKSLANHYYEHLSKIAEGHSL